MNRNYVFDAVVVGGAVVGAGVGHLAGLHWIIGASLGVTLSVFVYGHIWSWQMKRKHPELYKDHDE